jgi:hypothetical protein
MGQYAFCTSKGIGFVFEKRICLNDVRIAPGYRSGSFCAICGSLLSLDSQAVGTYICDTAYCFTIRRTPAQANICLF